MPKIDKIQVMTKRGRTTYSPPNIFVSALIPREPRGAAQKLITDAIDLMWDDLYIDEDPGDDKIHRMAELGETTFAAVVTFAITRYIR
jgi:hypothetical protein